MAAEALTAGAITTMCNLEGSKPEDWNPVVQVTDMRIANAAGAQPGSERYRVRISDGVYCQQGMLASQLNHLVSHGNLQRGSLIRLLDIVCTPVQGRLIILIVNLEMVLDKCDIIGEPVLAQKPANTPSPGHLSGNPESLGGIRPSANETVAGMSTIHPEVDRSAGNPYSSNVRYGASNTPSKHPKLEPGDRSYGYQNAGIRDSTPVSGPYGNQNIRDSMPVSGPYGNQNIGIRDSTPVRGPYGNQNTGIRDSTSVSGPYGNQNTGIRDSAPVSGPYGSQNPGFRNPGPEISRTPPNSYGHAPQPTYQQPPPMYTNRGPVARNEAPARVIPIAALNPYQGRWTIKARVTAKGELRHYNNPRGDGKVFSFDLLDSDGGEIRATCFNAVADQFYNQIEVGKIYMISRGSLKPAQKNFNHLRNDQEIFLESTSVVQPCFEDDNSIPRVQFHFGSIRDIEGMENNGVVDLIGVVSSIGPAGSIMRKNGTETQKRTLQLKDMSGRSVELTLWGNFCNAEGQRLQNMCDSGLSPVLAVKCARINDFNGKAVGTISSSQLFIEPEFPEAYKLREWFDKEGRNAPSVSISRETGSVGRADIRKTISQIKDEKLGTSEKPDWITVSSTISFIKVDNFCYTACPVMIGERQCNKKVTNNGDGKWRCDRCDQSVDECDYRYILQLQIQDHTGLTWVTAFQEGGEEIMGVSAKDLYYIKHEEQDDDKFSEIVRKVLFTKFLFKLKVKEEIYSDEQRVKSTVVKAEKVNHASESRFLLDQMEKLKREDSGTAPKVENIVPNYGMNNPGAAKMVNRQTAPVDYGNSAGAGREFGRPANQASQYGNQYSGSRPSATASSGMYMTCNSCGASGHSSVNCPSILNSQGPPIGGGVYGNRASTGPGPGPGLGNVSGECFKCHQTGHWARDCPGSRDVPPSYGSGGNVPGRYGGVARQHVGGF